MKLTLVLTAVLVARAPDDQPSALEAEACSRGPASPAPNAGQLAVLMLGSAVVAESGCRPGP
jgi:hypothetical protein